MAEPLLYTALAGGRYSSFRPLLNSCSRADSVKVRQKQGIYNANPKATNIWPAAPPISLVDNPLLKTRCLDSASQIESLSTKKFIASVYIDPIQIFFCFVFGSVAMRLSPRAIVSQRQSSLAALGVLFLVSKSGDQCT